MRRSPGEALLEVHLAELGVPFEIEHRFHPTRRWRFDFAIPHRMLAIEVEGGTYTGGRHTRGVGFEKDLEKLNTAALLGWTVYRFTTRQVETGHAKRIIAEALDLDHHQVAPIAPDEALGYAELEQRLTPPADPAQGELFESDKATSTECS